MKNKFLNSSIFVLCAGIVFYIISLPFFIAFNKVDFTGGQVYYSDIYPPYYSVPISAIQDQFLPGFIFVAIILIFMIIGGILLLMGYFKDRVDRISILIASIIVIFLGIGLSIITLVSFLIFDGNLPSSLDTSVSPHVYIISQNILNYYMTGNYIRRFSFGLIIIGTILLLVAQIPKKKPERNDVKEENSGSDLT